MDFKVGGNKGKKLVTEEIETTEEDDDDEEIDTKPSKSSSSGPSREEKRKMLKLMGLVLGGVFILMIIFFLITSAGSGKKSYEEIEDIMINASQKYFEAHPEYLPKKDGGTQTVDIATLVADGKMKELSEYTDVPCAGNVKVENASGTYLYLPNLNCGDTYKSQTLYQKITKDTDIVSSGYGLYSRGGNFVYRGESVNNFVQLDNAMWRIIKLTTGNEIVLIKSETLSNPAPWDDRYNEETSYNAGLNNYSSSRLKETVESLYTTKDESITKVLLSDKDKAKMVSFNMCIGKRKPDETGVEQAVECKELLRDQKIGLLTAADFMAASTDANCTTITSPTCQNYNYLVHEQRWWLATSSPERSYDVYMVESNNGSMIQNANNYARIRPVIHINGNVLYKGGTGTKEDPFTVK